MSIKSTHQPQRKSASVDFRAPARAGYAVIVLTFGALGLWAARAPLDSAAVAHGQIEVDSLRKPIQHLEGGIIEEILVKEAEAVKQGQVMFRLEPTNARANSDMLRKALDAAVAQEARLIAERDGSVTIQFPAELLDRQSSLYVVQAMREENKQFYERRQTIDEQVRIYDARREQAAHAIAGRIQQKAALESQLENLRAELDRVNPLAKRGLYPTNKLSALQRDKSRMEGDLGQARADIERLKKQRDETSFEIAEARQKFRQDAAQQLADVRNRLPELRGKLAIAKEVFSRVDIRAPVAGVVQNIHVTGRGAVVKAGETIAEVVPIGEELIIATQVSPLDIESVAAGEKAEIRFSSLPRRTTPTLFGRVQSVSADALVNETTKQPYYLARVTVNRADMPANIASKLTPGMPADVLIVTGERTTLEYLVEPLRNAIAEGMREK
jgi:membrane fusion protein, type I secretion system